MEESSDVQAAIDRVLAATKAFLNGDAEPYKACWSHGDDVSIFGGRGAYEVGWEEVGPRLEWVAASFADGTLDYELLVMHEGSDFAVTVGIERNTFTLADASSPARNELRVTHVYRREHDGWKVVHRHADPIIEKSARPALIEE
jgi:ketosteroid isomerase-like protein